MVELVFRCEGGETLFTRNVSRARTDCWVERVDRSWRKALVLTLGRARWLGGATRCARGADLCTCARGADLCTCARGADLGTCTRGADLCARGATLCTRGALGRLLRTLRLSLARWAAAVSAMPSMTANATIATNVLEAVLSIVTSFTPAPPIAREYEIRSCSRL